jgi:fermentation-respiration switch protein FrsA (DUF1100 family)
VAQRGALRQSSLDSEGALGIIDGATHMDLYDGPGVDQYMERLAPFFTNTL